MKIRNAPLQVGILKAEQLSAIVAYHFAAGKIIS